jgi:hypothetical protein
LIEKAGGAAMMKRKFGGSVRSKLFVAHCNEVLCKVLCHNLAVLVHEMRELGVVGSGNFASPRSGKSATPRKERGR